MVSPPALDRAIRFALYMVLASSTRPFLQVPTVRPRSRKEAHSLISLSLQASRVITRPLTVLLVTLGVTQQGFVMLVAHSMRMSKI